MQKLVEHAGGKISITAHSFEKGGVESEWLCFAKGKTAAEKRSCKKAVGSGVTFHHRNLLSDHALLHQFLDRSQYVAFVT